MNKIILFIHKLAPSIMLFLIFIITLASCDIKSPTAPSWDVNLSLPLFDTTYSLLDIIEKDSTVLKPDYTRQGLLVYSTKENIDTIKVEDKLTIDDFSSSSSTEIGSIKINSDSSKADVGFEWMGQSLPPGQSSTVLPEFNRSVSSILDTIKEFNNLKIESGEILISVQNHFSSNVNFTLKGLKLINVENNNIILQTNEEVIIPANSIGSFSPLSFAPNTVIKNRIRFETTVSSTGSNGQVIQIPQKTFTIFVRTRNFVAAEATAKIPNQNPVHKDSTLIIDENATQPTKFKRVKFQRGLLNITLKNNLDIDANISLEIYNLKNSSNANFIVNKLITRKSTVKFVDNLSLANYSLISLDNSPTNRIHYKFTFNVVGSNDYRTIKKNDSFEANVNFNSLAIKEFDGVVKPTILDQTRSYFKVESDELQKKFGFDQINLNNPIVELRLRPSEGAKLNFKLTGRIEGKNSKGEHAILFFNENTLSRTTISERDTIIRFNPDSLSNFFRRFSKLPDSIVFYAGGILNENYQQVIVTNTTSITGSTFLELALDLGISNASFIDSLNLDFNDDTRKEIRNLNKGELNFIVTNGLPVSISFTGKLFDANNRFLLYFPPKLSDQDTVLSIDGGITDQNGNVVTKTTKTIKLKLSAGDSDLIAKAKYMRVAVKLNTSRANNLPVKFRTKDDFKIKSLGTINYRLQP